VAVGFIALAGVAAETGVVMLIYLDHAWEQARARCRAEGRLPGPADLYGAVMEGAAAALQQALEMPEPPNRIECYDISNLQGTAAAGSVILKSAAARPRAPSTRAS